MEFNINQNRSKAVKTTKVETLIDIPLKDKNINIAVTLSPIKTDLINNDKTQDFEFLYW